MMKTNKKRYTFNESYAKKENKTKVNESLHEAEAPVSEAVRKVHAMIKALKEMDAQYFYPALLIYEVLGIEKPSEALIKAIAELADEYDSVYDSYLRDEIRSIGDDIEPLEAEVEIEDEVKVEEKLGEFKKGDALKKRELRN